MKTLVSIEQVLSWSQSSIVARYMWVLKMWLKTYMQKLVQKRKMTQSSNSVVQSSVHSTRWLSPAVFYSSRPFHCLCLSPRQGFSWGEVKWGHFALFKLFVHPELISSSSQRSVNPTAAMYIYINLDLSLFNFNCALWSKCFYIIIYTKLLHLMYCNDF